MVSQSEAKKHKERADDGEEAEEEEMVVVEEEEEEEVVAEGVGDGGTRGQTRVFDAGDSVGWLNPGAPLSDGRTRWIHRETTSCASLKMLILFSRPRRPMFLGQWMQHSLDSSPAPVQLHNSLDQTSCKVHKRSPIDPSSSLAYLISVSMVLPSFLLFTLSAL
jgi:hypothetical protein